MRTFLKNNLLAILVCVFAVGSFASATTITRPYSSSDYAGGTKAVGAYVNAEFQNIVSWLNNGNITSVNIGTGGVATANLASFSVTEAKIAAYAVTPGKLSAPNLKVTSSSSLFTLSNTVTPATITNLSTTITASGFRNLSVRLENNPGTYVSSGADRPSGGMETIGANALTVGSNIFFVRDASTTAHWPIAATAGTRLPCNFSYTEVLPPAATYTFTVKVSNGDASATGLAIFNCRLVVEEL